MGVDSVDSLYKGTAVDAVYRSFGCPTKSRSSRGDGFMVYHVTTSYKGLDRICKPPSASLNVERMFRRTIRFIEK